MTSELNQRLSNEHSEWGGKIVSLASVAISPFDSIRLVRLNVPLVECSAG